MSRKEPSQAPGTRFRSCTGGWEEPHPVSRWQTGEPVVQFLITRGRLESFAAADLAVLAHTQIARAALRVEATAVAALKMGDVDGAYVAAYDAYRMAAESLLACQGLRATGGDGSHVAVEDAVSAQFAAEISAFVKPTFERFRRTRHSAQYFDPSAARSRSQMPCGRSRKRQPRWQARRCCCRRRRWSGSTSPRR
jgi:hypothetical protein